MKIRRRLTRASYLLSLAVRTAKLPYSRVQAPSAAYFSACFSTSAPAPLGTVRARLESDFRPFVKLLAGKARETLPRQQHQKQSNFPRQLPRRRPSAGK